MGSWIEIYLRKGDIGNFLNNINFESDEPQEIIEYLFNLVCELRGE